MTFQLQSILLYRSDGEVRELRFELGALNIVTGASKTGKSSIIDIIDYCLGSRSFHVSAGVIRDSVAMYAISLQMPDGWQVLVGRPRPPGRQASTSSMHLSIVDSDAPPPPLSELALNTEVDAVKAYLSELSGIGENLLVPNSGSRPPLTATIRHALSFVLQSQGEVANPSVLFHSQAEEWVPQAIRDTIPYFLGALDQEHILKRQRLRLLSRELRLLRREVSDESGMLDATDRAAALVAEAMEFALIPAGDIPSSQVDAIALLTTALEANFEPELSLPDETGYLDALEERSRLRLRLGDLQAELRLVTRVAGERAEFDVEVHEQAARLVSLDLVPDTNGDQSICPVCSSNLDHPVTSVADLRRALEELTSDTFAVRIAEPRLQEVRAQLESQIAELREAIRRNAAATRAIDDTRASVAQFRDEAVRRAGVRGRVSFYLDTVRERVARSVVANRLLELEREIAALEADLAEGRTDDLLQSALSLIARGITAIASDLGLEHSDSPIRLDIQRLTVVADTPGGPIPMSSMGSGENWLGYHIAALLALHDWFIREARPVPRLLVLDQPSQVYFPADAAGDEAIPEDDEDRAALSRVMAQLRAAVVRHEGALQIILLDHADLQEPEFQDSVVERWRDGRALIPASWLT